MDRRVKPGGDEGEYLYQRRFLTFVPIADTKGDESRSSKGRIPDAIQMRSECGARARSRKPFPGRTRANTSVAFPVMADDRSLCLSSLEYVDSDCQIAALSSSVLPIGDQGSYPGRSPFRVSA